MSVYVSTTYLGDGSSILDATEKLKSLGIKKIELGSNHAKSPAKELFSLAQDQKVTYIAHNYFPAQDARFVLNIASQNNITRDKSIKFIKNTIKLCQRLNIKYYTIHPGFIGEVTVLKNKGKTRNFDFQFKKNKLVKNRQSAVAAAAQIIRDLYKFAGKYPVQLLVENEGSQTSPDHVIFDNPQELDWLKKTVGESLKFNFNLAHAILAGINLEDTETFLHFWRNSSFFETSEIQDDLDSHLPIISRGRISALLKKYGLYFTKKNVILEYRNINIKEVKKSYDYVTSLLNTTTPPVQ